MKDIRLLDQEDYSSALALISYAFQWELTEKNISRYTLLANHSWNYGSFDEEGNLASQIMATPFTVDLFGSIQKMMGIGFVASYPEYRSQGRIDRIMRKILEDCRKEGITLSYLAPFSYPFYRRYGYEMVFEQAAYEVAASDWPDSPKTSGRVKRHSFEDAKTVIDEIYQKKEKHHKGALIREPWWIENKFDLRKDYTYALYYTASGQVEGYLVYQISGSILQIEEWNYLSGEAFRGLNRFIASHQGSVATISFVEGFDGENIQFLASAPMADFRIKPYMMARVVDVEAFLGQANFLQTKDCVLAIEIEVDYYAPWNSGIYELRIKKGKAKVEKVQSTNLPKLSMTVQRFAQLFMGYKSVTELAFHQLLQGEPEIIELWEQLLPKQKPILEDYF